MTMLSFVNSFVFAENYSSGLDAFQRRSKNRIEVNHRNSYIGEERNTQE
jgi:hypothetical protein